MQMRCQQEKLKKERPESVTSAHAWLHERTGIPVTYVRNNAAPWLWMYKHWRYLPSKPNRPYPFYANFYRPFEDMLERDRARSLTEGNEENEA
jgi:hypothetical protein